MAGVKKATTSTLNFCPRQGRVFILPGVGGKFPRTGIPGFSRPWELSAVSGQSIPKATKLCWWNGATVGANEAVAEPVARGLGASQSFG